MFDKILKLSRGSLHLMKFIGFDKYLFKKSKRSRIICSQTFYDSLNILNWLYWDNLSDCIRIKVDFKKHVFAATPA